MCHAGVPSSTWGVNSSDSLPAWVNNGGVPVFTRLGVPVQRWSPGHDRPSPGWERHPEVSAGGAAGAILQPADSSQNRGTPAELWCNSKWEHTSVHINTTHREFIRFIGDFFFFCTLLLLKGGRGKLGEPESQPWGIPDSNPTQTSTHGCGQSHVTQLLQFRGES